MKCKICEQRAKIVRKLNKMDSYEREAKKTNKIKGFFSTKNPLEVVEKGLSEKQYETELCPKCNSSLMDVGFKFDFKNNCWKSHKHICSDRYKCGWESEEFKGDFFEII